MHDSQGRPLEKGDRVTMEFEVTDTWSGADVCNVQLTATGTGAGSPLILTCNAADATKIEAPAREPAHTGAR